MADQGIPRDENSSATGNPNLAHEARGGNPSARSRAVFRIVLWLLVAILGGLVFGAEIGINFATYFGEFYGGMFVGCLLGLTILGPLTFSLFLKSDKSSKDFSGQI